MYQKYRIFRTPCFSTLKINQCTYCDAIFFIQFSPVSHYTVKVTAKYFPQQPHICDTLTVKGEVLFNSSTKVALEIFSHTQQYAGWFVNCGHFCSMGQIFGGYDFQYFILVNILCERSVRPHVSCEKAAGSSGHCEISAVSVVK